MKRKKTGVGSRPRYTPEDDAVIVSFVNKYPQNLAAAFEEAARDLGGRSPMAVTKRYYNKLMHSGTPMLAIASATGVRAVNRKQQARPSDQRMTLEMRMNVVRGCIDKMSRDEKMQVVEHIMQI